MPLYTDTQSIVSSDCNIYGAESGTAEGAFACASGTDPQMLQWGLFGLFCALFILIWLRLVHQAWYKFLNEQYKPKDVANIVLMPALLFVAIAVIVSAWGFS